MMSTEAWLTLTGILVTLGLAGASAVFAVVGWFLSREIKANDREIQELKAERFRTGTRLTRIETILDGRGLLPKSHKYPSPHPEDTQ